MQINAINNTNINNVNTIKKENNNPSFGKLNTAGLKGYMKDNFTQLNKSGPMARGMFVLNAFTFLLGSRIVTARDADEKREIVIRDIPTVLLSVLGVPMIEKATAKVINKTTGFAVNQKYDVLKEWYQNGKTVMKNGKEVVENATNFKAFSKRLADQGADIKKVFSTLSPEIKKSLSEMTGSNEEIIKKISNNNELSKKIQEALKSAENGALKKANSLKTITKAFGFGLTLGLIGLLIPKINIAITKAIHKNDSSKPEAQKA
ncbi:MAG: hypothetical protein MJ229_02775 [bacterium]|nr:hypothetical protein [bacterium]